MAGVALASACTGRQLCFIFACALLAAETAGGSQAPECQLAIIGGGPSGVYTAWRLTVDTHTLKPSDVCVYERAARVGGRTFSLYNQGTKKDLTVDLGAYRFCNSLDATNCAGCEMCMPMMSNLIKGKLGLHTKFYQPSGGPHQETALVKVVDSHGENAGLSQYVERMHNESMAAGVRFFLHHEATSIQAPPAGGDGTGFTVDIRCTAPSFPVHASLNCTAGPVTAKRVLMNTPLLPAMRIIRNSPSLKPHFEGGKFPAFLRVPHAWRHIKLYVHYDWAWWRTLGKVSGDFSLYGPTPDNSGRWDGQCPQNQKGALMSCSSDTLPLEGRYHDGHVRCDDGNATGFNCRGFIEATYTSDGVSSPNVTFFEYFQSNADPPFSYVDRTTSADGEDLLDQVHERLMTLHEGALRQAGLWDKAHAAKPTNALLSMWDPKSPGFGAGTHGMLASKIPGGAYAPGAAAGTVAAKAIKPFDTLDLYIANEAFHPADWGEGGLEMAENVAHKFYNVTPPTWMAADTYNHIMFGPAQGPQPPRPSPPSPPAPAGGACPGVAQTMLNKTTVCLHAKDAMGCSVELSCTEGHFVTVDFANVGTAAGTCGAWQEDQSCTGNTQTAMHVVAQACLGRRTCSLHPNTNVFNPANPMICDGVVKSTTVQLTCGTGPSPPPPPPPPSPPPAAGACAGPFGKDLPPLLQHRPSGTPVPDFLVMAAPFTPFFGNGSINTGAILPLAKVFKQRLGINAVWVMGMRGQFDAMTMAERKAVAEVWVAAGKETGLFTIIQCGSSSTGEAAEVAAHAELIGADAIGSVGPFMELCSTTECVVDWVAPVAAAAPKTPFFYYHTPGWNGKSLNNVKMYDWFKYAATAIPTNVGVKFESYNDAEFLQTCNEYGQKKVMIYAPCNALGHWEQGTPGRGTFIQAFAAPMCHRIRAAYEKGDKAGMAAAAQFLGQCQNAGGNFVERYFYQGLSGGAVDFGPPRAPQPHATPASLAAMNATLIQCGFYDQKWPAV